MLSTLAPAQAKYRLVPKKERNKKNTNTKKKQHSDSGNTSHHRLILLPRQKKQQEAVNLKLEATVSTNEKGEKVLLLSPESTKAVETAMQSSGGEEVEEATMKMEAKQPKKKMTAEAEPAEPTKVKVLMYDPDELKTSPGEEPLPKRVFDENGNEVDMVDMAGKEALLVKPPPPQPETDDGETASTVSNESNEQKVRAENLRIGKTFTEDS